MKISTLSLIAGAMPAFGQINFASPLGDMATSIDAFEAIFKSWNGFPLFFPPVAAALEILQAAINATCKVPIPLQPDDIQKTWLEDGPKFVAAVNQTCDTTIDRLPDLDEALGSDSRAIIVKILQDFEDQLSPCFEDVETAFNEENQLILGDFFGIGGKRLAVTAGSAKGKGKH